MNANIGVGGIFYSMYVGHAVMFVVDRILPNHRVLRPSGLVCSSDFLLVQCEKHTP